MREHRIEIEAKRAKLNDLIETIRSQRNLVKGDLEIALNLSKQLVFLFEKGTPVEKRLFCEIIFRCVYIKGGKIMKTELTPPALITSASKASESFQPG